MSEAWKAEQRRQAQLFADAVQAAIDQTGAQLRAAGHPPILNALAGGLAGVVGTMLASVADPRHRKVMRKQFEAALPQAIAQARVGGFAETVIIGRCQQ